LCACSSADSLLPVVKSAVVFIPQSAHVHALHLYSLAEINNRVHVVPSDHVPSRQLLKASLMGRSLVSHILHSPTSLRVHKTSFISRFIPNPHVSIISKHGHVYIGYLPFVILLVISKILLCFIL
jgi:hypothetical protein